MHPKTIDFFVFEPKSRANADVEKTSKKFLLEIYILTAFQFWDKKNRSRELGDLNVSNRMLSWGGGLQGDSQAFANLVSSFDRRLMCQ